MEWKSVENGETDHDSPGPFSPSAPAGDEFSSTFLIRHLAQVNAATVGAVETPLHLVCSFSPKKHSGEVMSGMAHIAEALLKTGANPNRQNSKGRWVILYGNPSDPLSPSGVI